MGQVATCLMLAGVSLGRFAAFVMIAVLAVPAMGAAPAEPAAAGQPSLKDFNLAASTGNAGREPNQRSAYPTEQPRVPVDDAFRPPQLLWNPTPTSLVKVAPRKVRYKLKF
jgi:hypothetical protein